MACVLLPACATGPAASSDQSRARPAWIDNPGDGVSASAGLHARGEAAQEQLAIARAREEMAKRNGVSVSSEQLISQAASSMAVSLHTAKETRESMADNAVRARVAEKWRDPTTGALWVWLVPSP